MLNKELRLMKSKKVITIATLVGVLLFVHYSINAAPLISDSNYAYIANMKWYKSFDEGKAVAQKENKPMLVYFWAVWCQYCEKLHTEVYSAPEISSLLKEQFVLVSVDLDSNRADAQKFGVAYPPHLIFATSSGDIIFRIPGYLPKEELLPVLSDIAEGHKKLVGLEGLPNTQRVQQ